LYTVVFLYIEQVKFSWFFIPFCFVL
jgi:hypothetical protein